MRKILLGFLAILVIAAAQAAFAQQTQQQPMEQGQAPRGAMVVETQRATATVKSVDAEKNTVTLEMPDGETKTLKVGKNVDASRIKAGDKINATFIQEVAISVDKGPAQPGAKVGESIMVAPKGGEPGAIATRSMALTAKVESVDTKKGTLTLLMPDGKTRTMKLGPNVRRAEELKKGDEVTVNYTEALIMRVERP